QLSADIDTLQWLDGSARGRVLLAWRNALDVDAQLEASGLALDALDAGIAGRIGGNIHLRAAFGGAKPDIALQIASLDGDIAGEAITGSGSLRLLDGKLMTKGLVVDAGNAHLELDDAVSGFDFRIDVPALGVFHPGVGGQLRASGHFNGELASPTLRVDAAGSGVSWQEWRANAFQLDMEVVRGGEKDSIVQFEGNGIGTPFMEAGQLRMGARGTRGAHRLQMRVAGADTGGNGGLEIALEGAFENSAWRGDIGELRIEHPLAGTWQLAEPQSERILRFEAKTWKIPEHCLLSSSGGSACAGAASQAQGWSTQGALRSVPVAVIAGLLPEGLDYDGAISGNFRVNARQRIEGDASFTLTAGGIRQAAGEGAETLLGWIGGEASVRFRNESAHAQLDIDLVDGGEITGNGRLEMPPGEPSRIDAELRASLDNLRLVPSLVPELSRLEGRVTARLDIEGRLDQPRVRGEAQLRDGRARILALGTDWKNVTLDLAAAGREISMTGHAESGGGHIDIELDAQDTGDGLRGKARLTGENFKAVHTPEANIDISPRLALALQDRDLYIDGSVTVPFARIEPRDLSAAAQPSEDQVIVNAEKRAADDGLRVHVAVTTHLGDDVRVNALGLKAKMDGQLTVTQQPGGPATGNGRLVIVEGEYKAYGQDLTLAKGEIIYTGQPLANPGLDIRAERKPQPDITVGVAVRGPLAQPATTVYSDPPMSETEALAWLLFGRSIEQATGEEEGQISEAAIALGLGGQRLLGRVGRKLGVEEVRVEDVGDPERASLVLGKYLSPDLYVSYGIGLFDAVNSFRIRYRISSKWMLEATSGLKSSADFLYTIER
ncbi:MAG TPA: translocation/assembly module TamB domain-containing protein, partial [Gammaproteobacteria bacterium]